MSGTFDRIALPPIRRETFRNGLRAVVARRPGVPLAAVRRRFTHLLVDEYQETLRERDANTTCFTCHKVAHAPGQYPTASGQSSSLRR